MHPETLTTTLLLPHGQADSAKALNLSQEEPVHEQQEQEHEEQQYQQQQVVQNQQQEKKQDEQQGSLQVCNT